MADVKWIKITTDIFDDEKILLIEALPDAYAIITCWFKLLCLAGKANNGGIFYLNNKIPYTNEMLASIFRMKDTTVQMALQTFEGFGMIEVIDGVITIPNWDKHQTLDKYELHKQRDRERKQKSKEAKQQLIEHNSAEIPQKFRGNGSYSNSISKYINNKYYNNETLNSAFIDYIDFRKKIKKPMTDRAITLAISNLNKLSKGDENVAVEIINQSVMNGWTALYELKTPNKTNFSQRADDLDARMLGKLKGELPTSQPSKP